MRSRRAKVLLISAVVIALGAAAPFAPRVYWRARVAWASRGLASADEEERWKARLALLELPRERIDDVLPRIVAGAALDDAEHGCDVWLKERDKDLVQLEPARTNVPTPQLHSVLAGARSRLGSLPRGDDQASVYVMIRKNESSVLQVWAAPLDPDGETVRLLRERFR